MPRSFTSEFGHLVGRFVKVGEVKYNLVLDVRLIIEPITYFIFEGQDFVPTPSIKGRGVKEFGVRVAFT